MKRAFLLPMLLGTIGLTVCFSAGCGQSKAPQPDGGPPPGIGPGAPNLSGISGVQAIACSPDGNLLAATWGNGTYSVGIWQRSSGEPKCPNISGYYERLVFTPDSKLLVGIGSTQNKMTIWDANTGNELRHAELPNWKEKRGVTLATFLALSPDGKDAISVYDGVKVARLRLADAKLELFETGVPNLLSSVYSPKLDQFVVIRGFPERLVAVKPVAKASGKDYPLSSSGQSLALSEDGKTLAVALKADAAKKLPERIELWDTTQWKARATLPKEAKAGFKAYERMALSADGKYLVGVVFEGFAGKAVDLWDTAAATVRTVGDSGAEALVFTPDGTTLLLGNSKGISSVKLGGNGK